MGPGHMVEVVLGGRSTLYHVYKRPFVDYFLKKVKATWDCPKSLQFLLTSVDLQVSTWYTLVIFTASMQEYADPVIDWLDAGRGILAKRFFREVGLAPVKKKHVSVVLTCHSQPALVMYPATQRVLRQRPYDYRIGPVTGGIA